MNTYEKRYIVAKNETVGITGLTRHGLEALSEDGLEL